MQAVGSMGQSSVLSWYLSMSGKQMYCNKNKQTGVFEKRTVWEEAERF